MDTNTNNIKKTSIGIFSFLSFYAPLIITISILITSIFGGVLGKGLYFLFWILVISFTRIFIIYIFNNKSISYIVPEQCNVGNFLPLSTPTYSTFILTFTLAYLILPTYILQKQTKTDTINYILMLFLLSYIVLDILVKLTLGCINSNSTSTLIGEILGGLGLGSLISSLTYNSPIRSNLFINELTNNKQICSMPSKQKFKCSVYKNGELVSTTMK
jgi:hypothetical protein